MILKSGQVGSHGRVLGEEASSERLARRTITSIGRQALLAGAGALALLIATPFAANALPPVIDTVPDVIQTNNAPDNDNADVPGATTANAVANDIQPVLLPFVDVPSASSIADATAIVKSPTPGLPVLVNQLNNDTTTGTIAQLNIVNQDFDATATAVSQDVDITNTNPPIVADTTGLSSATSLATISTVTRQRNENQPPASNRPPRA